MKFRKSRMILTNEELLGTKIWKISDFLLLGTTLAFVGIPLLKKIMFSILLKRRKKLMLSKIVLITGASSGLGEALSHTFYKAGCKVILAARRESELKRVYKDLLALKVEVTTCVPDIVLLDLENFADIPEIINKIIEKHKRIDILINNGGISVRGDVLSTSVDVYTKIMLTNFLGSVALTKEMDPNTANGIHADVMANYIFLSILKNDKDVVFAQTTAKLAYWIKVLFPNIYFWIMEKRANVQIKDLQTVN